MLEDVDYEKMREEVKKKLLMIKPHEVSDEPSRTVRGAKTLYSKGC